MIWLTACVAEPLPRPGGGSISGAEVRSDLATLGSFGLRLGLESFCGNLPRARKIECNGKLNDQWFWGTRFLEAGIASVQEIRPTTYYSTASTDDCIPRGYFTARLYMRSLVSEGALFDATDELSLQNFNRETARAALLTGRAIAGACAADLLPPGEDEDHGESAGNFLCNIFC
jgi:hypothetical protein